MCIRRTQDVNAVLLAKLNSTILADSGNIWVKVLSTKYLTKVNFLEGEKTVKASTMWKYIFDHIY